MDTTDHVPKPITNLMPIGQAVRHLQRHYPSVTPSSLRFLEREGLIEPERTTGGHRVYSPDHIQRVLDIKAWQEQGLPLEQIRERLHERDHLPDTRVMADEFFRLVLDRHILQARTLVLNADSLGVPLVQIFGEILQPALYEIGVRWEGGLMVVAQEKEASELMRDIISELSHRHDQGPSRGLTLIAGCIQGEQHELGLRMITGLLRSRGYVVRSLGADVEAEFFAQAVQLHRPAAVLLSVKLQRNLDRVRDVARAINEATAPEPAPMVLVGGEAVGLGSGEVAGMGAIPIHAATLDGVIDCVISHLDSI